MLFALFRKFFGPRLAGAWRLVAIGLVMSLSTGLAQAADDFVVIGHASLPKVDGSTLQRLYTGRAIEVAGIAATVVNLRPGQPVRDRFLSQVVQLDNERYIAYWTVRRHIGKGVPPREFGSAAEVIDYVQRTPGALGYIATSELRPGLNVVFRP